MDNASYPLPMAEKTARFGFVWTEEEAAALEEWCFQNRIASKSGAVRALVSEGLKLPATPEIVAAAKAREPKK